MSDNTHDGYNNPFDDDQQTFIVLVNSQSQYSIWPVFASAPAGWQHCFGPAGQAECLDWVEEHWTQINPFADAG